MQIEQVKQLLESKLEGCVVYPEGEGCNFQVTVVGEVFEGLRPVKNSRWFPSVWLKKSLMAVFMR